MVTIIKRSVLLKFSLNLDYEELEMGDNMLKHIDL